MPATASKYQTLSELTFEWSVQAGELPQLVLRRICDWAISKAFPAATFVSPNGQHVDLVDLHRAMRIVIGIGAPMNEEAARALLLATMVSRDGISDFCDRIGVDPPPGSATLRSRFRRLVGKARQPGPPDCPGSSELVAKLEAGFSAINAMKALKSQLPRAGENLAAEVAEQAKENWRRYAEYAQSEADASGDLEIQGELVALKQRWEALAGATNEAANDEMPSEGLLPKKRPRGRPPGSGSLENEDRVIVEAMHDGFCSGKFTSIAAAARAFAPSAGGGGTLASIEKRLSNRYTETYPG